jgi:hypothetical protein
LCHKYEKPYVQTNAPRRQTNRLRTDSPWPRASRPIRMHRLLSASARFRLSPVVPRACMRLDIEEINNKNNSSRLVRLSTIAVACSDCCGLIKCEKHWLPWQRQFHSGRPTSSWRWIAHQLQVLHGHNSGRLCPSNTTPTRIRARQEDVRVWEIVYVQ